MGKNILVKSKKGHIAKGGDQFIKDTLFMFLSPIAVFGYAHGCLSVSMTIAVVCPQT